MVDAKAIMTFGAGIVLGSVVASYLNLSRSAQSSFTKKSFHSSSSVEKPMGLDAEGLDVAGTGENRLLRKAETVLRQRTSQIMLVIERSVDTHNYSAIIRTAEAMGIHHLWVISPPSLSGNVKDFNRKKRKDLWVNDEKKKDEHVAFAKKAGKWVNIRNFESTEECLKSLAEDGRELWVTELSQMAEDLDDVLGRACPGNPLPEKLAIVFGSEGMGVSSTMLDAADRRIYLKMRGFADSLNLSVSAAMVMQRLILCDPNSVGNMSNEERALIRSKWYPKMARNDDQRERFIKIAADENAGINVIRPYVDVRRPEEHRRVWSSKKSRKKLGEIGLMKYQGEI
jgi:tRNA (guanosine-2'-O-)-methyltransferase